MYCSYINYLYWLTNHWTVDFLSWGALQMQTKLVFPSVIHFRTQITSTWHASYSRSYSGECQPDNIGVFSLSFATACFYVVLFLMCYFILCVLNQDMTLFCDSVILIVLLSNARTIFLIHLNNLAGHMFVGQSVRLLTGCWRATLQPWSL